MAKARTRSSVSSVAGLIGKAAADASFRKRFLANPAAVAKAQGLPAKEIEAIARVDKKALEKAVKGMAVLPNSLMLHSSIHSSIA